jgi:predicted lipoprotein
MFTKQFIVSMLIVILASGCVDKKKGDEPASIGNLSVALQQVVDNAVLPAVDQFLVEANAFDSAADDFCSLLDETSLLALQQQWAALFEQWYRLSIYNFGPLDDDIVFPTYTFIDSLRLRGTDYTGTVRSEITANIGGDQALDEPYFSNKTFNRVGLLALESAVFETASGEHSQLVTNIIAEYQATPRKCEVLAGLSEQIVKHARYVEDGWLVAHKNSTEPYRTLFLDNQLDDGTEPLVQLITSVQEFLDYLQKRNVVITAAQLSARSWQAIAATIDEVELLLEGSEQTTDSLFGIMILTGNQNAVDSVEATIANIRQSISDRDAAMLEITLGQLDGHFKREIPDGLDVILGINFTDGD